MVPSHKFMKLIFIFLIFLQTSLFSQYDLMNDYIFSNSTITGKDLFPDIDQDIFIYRVPNGKTRVSINSSRVIEKFKQYGIEINKRGVRRVKFIKVPKHIYLDSISDYIVEEFQNLYPMMEVEKVYIYPKRNIKKLPENYSIIFKNSNLKKSEGYFYIENERREKVHFKYVVKAFINIIKSAERIHRGSILDFENTYSRQIEFKRFRNSYIKENQLGRIIAKSYIPKDRELTERQISKIKLIKRGQYIKGFIRDGVVYIEVEVKALQSGGIEDLISVETPEGVRLRAKIISGKLVKIL